ncbi:MAG: DUF4426 domain-containing protein [Wenzhouxiangellaceae bacterium]|nr:DUF4426 domain-containing protein [Wenzhouxiangellaceae bacterium]
MRLIPAFAFTLLMTLSLSAFAQQAERFGPYEIHYSTLNTSMLSPEIAAAYGIQRAGTQAMLNVTVLEKASGQPRTATIEATATNLTGQRRDIELREINDQGAIYYIGQFRIHDEETLDFRISVRPHNHEGAPYVITFRQQFFTG